MSSLENPGYDPLEEKWNVLTHGLGILLSVAGAALLITFASIRGDAWHIVSFSIFGASMIVLYVASTTYHAATDPKVRRRLNIFDHAAIYILIAGSYTPFCLVTLKGALGWVLFGIAWGLALIGVTLKLFFTGQFERLSTVSYVLMGWIAIIAGRSLWNSLEGPSLTFLLLGGLSYTVGAVFYLLHRLKFNHAIFHLFVLGGTICHFFAVFYLL